jgi:hypothetical protein
MVKIIFFFDFLNIELSNKDGITALYIAAKREDLDTCVFLINNGADVTRLIFFLKIFLIIIFSKVS